ncbi:DUF2201 family putative metallopeptidase [Pseudactinotalea sp. Z1748]|uniref:vWA domain-containing protein n=1 Tax=Pseudactinotalea sp. Z1748 TaxID=3413027 RepID=UPI003C7C426D
MELTKPCADQHADFSAWRAVALSRMPYMAAMLFSVRVLNAPGLGTFAVDAAHRLYIDFDEVTEWGTTACAEVLLHEVGHLFGEHTTFAKDFGVTAADQKVWNAAADASINDDLAAAGCGYIASTGIMPAKLGEPDFQTAQHYYGVLKGLQQQQRQQQSGGQGASSSANSGQPDSSGSGRQPQDADTGHGQGSSSDGDGQGKPFAGCGSGSGGQAAPVELDAGDDFDGQAPGASSGERKRLLVATAAQIIEHASRGRGNVPGGLVEQAEQLLTPSTTPWQRIIGSMVRRVVRRRAGQERTDYTRRDRRRHNVRIGTSGARVVYPGRSAPKVRLAVVRDTSGSMGPDELTTVTNEIVGISRRLRIKGKDLQVLDVDADVHTTRGFTGARSLNEVHGRGGTDMRVGIEQALRTPGGVDVVVVITDGGTPWPDERPAVPVIACLVGPWAEDTVHQVPDFITRVVIENPAA